MNKIMIPFSGITRASTLKWEGEGKLVTPDS